MSLSLDKNYNIEISLKDSKLKKDKSIELYTTDQNIFNIFVKLIDSEGNIIPNAELDGYEVEMRIVRPDLAFKRVVVPKHSTDDCLEVDLGADVITTAGTYKFEFLVTKGDEKITTSSDSFVIKDSITAGLVEASSLSIMSIKELSPNLGIDELRDTKIDDMKMEKDVLKMYANNKVVREIYLKAIIKQIMEEM